MLIPSFRQAGTGTVTSLSRRVNANSQRVKCFKLLCASLSRRVNANSQLVGVIGLKLAKLIKKGEC